MEVTIEGSVKEIGALVAALQERRHGSMRVVKILSDGRDIARYIHDMLPLIESEYKGGENMEYISERVTNISEIESIIKRAYDGIDALRREMEKENPSMVRIDELSKQLHLHLLKAKNFEFCVERRKTVISY